MDFDLEQRTARLSVGEFADFTLGPRDSLGGSSGIWRAQLGTHWHQQLRIQTTSERADAAFEVPITGQIFHHGWTLTLTGRIDQIVPGAGTVTLREIKTVTRELPVDDSELRADYPAYFLQLAAYATLAAPDRSQLLRDVFPQHDFSGAPRAELHFVEVVSGLAQSIELTPADHTAFRAQLERVVEFFTLRLRARERLRTLRFRPAFTEIRAGQETTQADLAHALSTHPIVFFEAPTGFGKTGALLELALGQLRSGRFERVLYLTSKATGQLQVMRTLNAMTAPEASSKNTADSSASTSTSVAAWVMRPKREHCIHHTYHCSRDVCPHLADAETRWARSGLAKFYLFENEPRDLESLRTAGRNACICPYEITRAALPFNDVWIGDYNYVFAPSNRGIFFEQPGFNPAQTLLLIDEAHNLPSRVADVYTHTFSASDATALTETLHRLRVPQKLVQASEHWTHFLQQRVASDALPLADEDDARDLLDKFARLITTTPVDTLELGQPLSELLWKIPACIEELGTVEIPRLWWSPRAGDLVITCLDAAAAIGPTLRSFGAAILSSATLSPTNTFAAACGLDAPIENKPEKIAAAPDRLGQLNKRDTRKLFKQLTSAAELLKVEEARELSLPALVRATTPWRENAYEVAIDLRVDTSYQQRARHTPTTAATLAALCASAAESVLSLSSAQPRVTRCVAAFFPSYAFADSIQRELAASHPHLRIALQPRLPDLAAQTAWVEQALVSADALFLVLGSSFAEGIDLLGGRVTRAIVVGPALPEVNAVQRARLATCAPLGREGAFQRVYQIPGIQKVNQALGRLVRAPGQRAKILLHCRRFAEQSYAGLLAPEYQTSRHIETDDALDAWLRDEN